MNAIKRALGQSFQEERNHFGVDPSYAGVPPVQARPRAISVYRGGIYTPAEIGERIARRQAEFFQIPIVYTTTPVLILPASNRCYFLFQNLDAALDAFLGFSIVPNQATSLGLRVSAGDAYEPYMVPQNDVWVTGTGTGAATLLYAVI
jgi:hypothetical protein